jgi:xylulokinase
MNYLGLDIGTSRCKAAVFDGQGHQIAEAFRAYDVQFSSDGGAVLDPDLVISRCFDVIKECTSQVGNRSVAGLGISCQGEAFTPIDHQGKTLAPAMVTSDLRALTYAKRWPESFGKERLYQITGQTPHPMFTLFKILWIKDHLPDIWEKTYKFLCFEDLMQYRLGIDPAIAWSLAGRTMLFDVRQHHWSEEILNAIGLTEEKLARPLPSGRKAGKMTPGIATTLGLAEDAFVVTAGHDQPCAALGADITHPASAIYAMGTVECITPTLSRPVFSDILQKNNFCTYDHTVEGMYVTLAYSLTGGNLLKWFRDEFGAREMAEAEKTGTDPYDLILSQMTQTPAGPMVLPYFTPSGTPYFDTSTKGAVIGLRLTTSKGEFLRALLEGVALEMRLNLEILESAGYNIEVLHVVGGGAKSMALSQLKADVTGKQVVLTNVTEAGCLGAAVLVRSAHTGTPITDIAGNWVKRLKEIKPNPEFRNIYSEKFEKYKKLYHKIKEINM